MKDVIFEVQSVATGAFDPLSVNAAADIATNGGNATTGISSCELDTTYGTTGQCTVIGVSYNPNNSDVASANVNLYVTVRESNLFAAVAGI